MMIGQMELELHKRPSQARQIIHHMEQIGPLTHLAALRLYGIGRLAARIHEIQAAPFNRLVRVDMIRNNGKRFAQYSLEDRHV